MQFENLKNLLEEQHSFPCEFMFKFIVPQHKTSEVKAIFEESATFTTKDSSGGKYTSCTIHVHMESPDAIVNVYKQAAKIEGLISL